MARGTQGHQFCLVRGEGRLLRRQAAEQVTHRLAPFRVMRPPEEA